MRLQSFIITQIEKAITLLYELSFASDQKSQVAVRIEQPSHMEHGDYSTNIAMLLAKVMRKSPMILASEIAAQLTQDGMMEQLVVKIEVAPPGFMNLFIDWGVWARRDWQLEATGEQKKAIVEHTSINPNKSAHIGHLRNACIGDSIVRLLRRTGVEVEVHNYIDDLGNQLADTVVGMLHTPLQQAHARFGDFCWDVYSSLHREYKVRPALEQERSTILHALEEGNNNIAWMGMLVAERIVREQLEEMEQFGIGYHLLVWESNIVREGFWDAAFALLQQTPQFKQETTGKLAGCWVLKQGETGAIEEHGDDPEVDSEHQQDKVLVRSNGILTYTAKDIAYHLWKFGLLGKDFGYKRFADGLFTTTAAGGSGTHAEAGAFGQADTVINVIDARQAYPQMMVKQALEVLGFTAQANQLRHISYGVVSLSPRSAAELGIDTSDGKAAYAMSGRQGIGIKISQLLDLMEQVIADNRSNSDGLSSRLIAAASIRYYLLRFNLQTEVVFDLQQATEISGNTGVYLLYAYARASTLLNRAAEEHGIMPQNPAVFPLLHRAEYALLRQIALWPDTLHKAAEELSPSLICTYAHELATLFNNFYGACPILKGDETSKAFRVWLTSKFHETLGDALQTLGLPTPERM